MLDSSPDRALLSVVLLSAMLHPDAPRWRDAIDLGLQRAIRRTLDSTDRS
jgi:hypothetical protein